MRRLFIATLGLVLSATLFAGCGAVPNNAPSLSSHAVATYTQKSMSISQDSIQKLLEDVRAENGVDTYHFPADKDPVKAAASAVYRLQPLFGSTIQSSTMISKTLQDNDHGRYYHIAFRVKLADGNSLKLNVDVLREFYGDDYEDSHIYEAVEAQVK